MDKTQDLTPFNNIGQFIITENDLPLSCPLPTMNVWNAHPRVYFPIEKTGHATCPYCGAHYIYQGPRQPVL